MKAILFRYSFLLILISIFFASCDEKEAVDEATGPRANDPLMTARNIDVLLSDSGHISARLTSGLLYRYGGDNPYLEFPKGFKIYLFDSAQNITSTIEGNRGIRREYARIMEAWGSVVVRNEVKKEQLNTEHLIWDENQHRIWSDVRVRITTPDKILFGDAMESNEAFSRYSIKNPTGLMMVKKDSI